MEQLCGDVWSRGNNAGHRLGDANGFPPAVVSSTIDVGRRLARRGGRHVARGHHHGCARDEWRHVEPTSGRSFHLLPVRCHGAQPATSAQSAAGAQPAHRGGAAAAAAAAVLSTTAATLRRAVPPFFPAMSLASLRLPRLLCSAEGKRRNNGGQLATNRERNNVPNNRSSPPVVCPLSPHFFSPRGPQTPLSF